MAGLSSPLTNSKVPLLSIVLKLTSLPITLTKAVTTISASRLGISKDIVLSASFGVATTSLPFTVILKSLKNENCSSLNFSVRIFLSSFTSNLLFLDRAFLAISFPTSWFPSPMYETSFFMLYIPFFNWFASTISPELPSLSFSLSSFALPLLPELVFPELSWFPLFSFSPGIFSLSSLPVLLFSSKLSSNFLAVS